MRALACSACLTGSLLLAGPVGAEKPGGQDPFYLTDGQRKSVAPADRDGWAGRIDRSDLARLMRSPASMDAWGDAPGTRVEDNGKDRPIHPLFRRSTRQTRALSGLEWQENGSMQGLRNRYEAIGNSVKSRVFGKGLADNVDVELDGSPEIEFRFEFD